MTCTNCNGEGFVRTGDGIDACELCALRARAEWAGYEAGLEAQATRRDLLQVRDGRSAPRRAAA